MRSQAMTRVLVFDDRALNGDLRQELCGSGLQLIDAPDLESGIRLLHESDEPMTALFWVSLENLTLTGLDQAALLGTLLLDERLARRHAFILVTPTPVEVQLSLGNLLERVHVAKLTAPLDRERLLSAIWLATQRTEARVAAVEAPIAALI